MHVSLYRPSDVYAFFCFYFTRLFFEWLPLRTDVFVEYATPPTPPPQPYRSMTPPAENCGSEQT